MSRSVVAAAGVLALAAQLNAAQNPVLYYNFEEGTGSAMTNQGSLGGSGTLQNPLAADANWTAGPTGSSTPGGALYLDGVSGSAGNLVTTGLTLGQLGMHGAGAKYTAAAWVRVDAFGNALGHTNGDGMVFGQGGSSNWLHLGYRNNDLHFGHYGNDTADDSNHTTGVWRHIAWSYNGYEQRIYINGTLVEVGRNKGPLQTNSELWLGNTSNNRDRGLQGAIDDVVIYNKVVKQDDLAKLATGTSPLTAVSDVEAARAAVGGPMSKAGQWGIREVINNGSLGNLTQTENSVTSGNGTIVDYHRQVINIQDVGARGNMASDGRYEVVNRGLATYGSVSNLAMVANARVVVPTSGNWTFLVNSDDGFQLTLRDKAGNIVGFRGYDGQAGTYVSDYGALRFDKGRSVDNSFGFANLTAGQYDVELLYWQGGSASAVEVFAAPGEKTGFDASFGLIGDNQGLMARKKAISVSYNGSAGMDAVAIYGITPTSNIDNADKAAATIRDYWSTGNTAGGTAHTATIQNLNLQDPNGGGGRSENRIDFPGSNDGVPNDYFIFGARGTMSVDLAGYYVFNTLTDDNMLLKIAGTSGWTGYGNAVTTFADGFKTTGCCRDSFGMVYLNPGDYDFEFFSREGGGGAYANLFVSYFDTPTALLDRIFGYDSRVFQTLGTTMVDGTEVAVHQGLEIVAIPTPAALPAGLALLAIAALRRRA